MVEKASNVNNSLSKGLESRDIAKKIHRAVARSGISNPELDAIVGDNTQTVANYSPKENKFAHGPRVKGIIDSSNVVSVFDEYSKVSGGQSLIADLLKMTPLKRHKRIEQTEDALATRARKLGLEKEAEEFSDAVDSQLRSTLLISDVSITESFHNLIERIHEKEKHPSVVQKQQHTPTFYILREPEDKYLDVDGDRNKDINHSKAIEINVKDMCPAAKRLTDTKEKPDAVVITYITPKKIGSLGRALGLPLTPDNLSLYKDIVAKKLDIPDKKVDKSKLLRRSNLLIKGEIINKFIDINNYSQQKVPVFVAAGNEPNDIAVEAFLDGTKAVGALTPDPSRGNVLTPNNYSSDNDLIEQWEQGTIPIKVIRDSKDAVAGYNITGGNNVDVSVDKTTSKGKNRPKSNPNPTTNPYEIIDWYDGTCPATGKAAGRYLRDKFGDDCDRL